MENDDLNSMSEDQANRVAYLVAGYIRKTLTEKEHDELDDWITANDENQELFEELTDPAFIQKGLEAIKRTDADAVKKNIKSKIGFEDNKVAKKRKVWMPYSIAASIVLLTGLVLFFMLNKKQKGNKELIGTEVIKPGGNFATLTLTNGNNINLYDAKNGLLDSANGHEVLKASDGQISYEKSLIASTSYHVLTTPAGGQYSVTLPDGSRVWLNSSSSLKYPVGFSSNEREVELDGEAYFEVAPLNSSEMEGLVKASFIVRVNGMRVEVLGTHFNINAYNDEATINTSLFEGKVVVKSETSNSQREMVPGEQAKMDKSGVITISKEMNADEVLGWKNGLFVFKEQQIENIMRQVGRWYNATIEYEGKNDHHFTATIKRNEPIGKLLEYLEETERVRFKVEGKKIIVLADR